MQSGDVLCTIEDLTVQAVDHALIHSVIENVDGTATIVMDGTVIKTVSTYAEISAQLTWCEAGE